MKKDLNMFLKILSPKCWCTFWVFSILSCVLNIGFDVWPLRKVCGTGDEGSLVTWGAGLLLGVFCPARFPQLFSPTENHTEISISYTAGWFIMSGFLLVLVTCINPLFSYILAIWLSTFSSWQIRSSFFGDLGKCGRNQVSHSQHSPVLIASLLFRIWFSCLYFCLASQRWFKTWLTE